MMVNIGTLGTAATFAFGINQNTEIAGFSRVGGAGTPFHAFKWHNGVFTDLGTLGGVESFAYDINDQGCVVGESEIDPAIPELTHAFVWCDGVMTDLGTLGGPVSAAGGINENGQIVGTAMTADFEVHAFLYQNGVMTDLGVLPEGHFSGAVGINARGQMVGINSPDPDNGLPRSAVLWYKSLATELPLLFGSQEGFANDINASGVIVGMSTDSLDRRHAAVWAPR
jgi:probable HAF family extracellular repeat protein